MKNVAAGFSLRWHRLESLCYQNFLMDGQVFLVPEQDLGNEGPKLAITDYY